jgi:hypothetical protein
MTKPESPSRGPLKLTITALRRLLSPLFWFVAALVVLLEEWLWEPIRRLMARFATLPLVRGLSAGIARLPARWAAVVFLGPVLALVPFKLTGLWLIAHGQLALGLSVFIAAKLLGTALFAWLFSLTRPTLLGVPWFARLYAWVLGVRDTVHHWLRRQRTYRLARYWLRRLKRWLPRRRLSRAGG